MLHISHMDDRRIACLAVAMTAATYLVIDEMTSTVVAVFVTALVAAVFVLVWFALPLSRPYSDDEEMTRTSSTISAATPSCRGSTRARYS